MFIKKKKIKLNGKYFNLKVKTYENDRIQLVCENETEEYSITINIDDLYIDKGKVFIDPSIKKDDILKQLKKARIIKEICGVINYNYVDIPIAKINMGILRQYDYNGVNNYLNKVNLSE